MKGVENMNSFQVPRDWKIMMVAMPGRASGKNTYQNTPKSVQPSIRPASPNSLGIESTFSGDMQKSPVSQMTKQRKLQ